MRVLAKSVPPRFAAMPNTADDRVSNDLVCRPSTRTPQSKMLE
jgi:hypothetical protein